MKSIYLSVFLYALCNAQGRSTTNPTNSSKESEISMPASSSTPAESSTTEETIEMSTTEEPETTTNFDEELERREKSLLNTFPFNREVSAASSGRASVQSAVLNLNPLQRTASVPKLRIGLIAPLSKQGYQEPIAQEETNENSVFGSVVTSKPDADGKRCVDKVEMVTETVYDEVISCDHSYDRRCHTSYTTSYEAQQEEECEENYIKRCYIAYEPIAYNETIQICRTPLVKDCAIQGESVCRTVYESECWTKQQEHAVTDDVVDCVTVEDEKCEDETVGYTTQTKCEKWPRQECSVKKEEVKKYTPVTGCTKEPTELCAPAGCGFKEGAPLCQDKIKTIVQEKPTEECDIEPVRTCKHVTKLVPKLEPREECVDVPKEICTRSQTNPTKVAKPVIKKWCYVPSKESGLA
ncbi:uncharacterized protein LOC111696443 [Eurytemora carolleeae]|uniref:uncharacterized protein LOC111696443 n=1 Tax=Eurytemora carolleeae TaxID=1294199 RepID=UPI000C76EE34|nr:uncharacterized protein LOC111696443 [Eurytemora carolleeae]|eukprot:XP_023321813.1 uncharacterized protein LOC111696443 [Eurytemora affinis]